MNDNFLVQFTNAFQTVMRCDVNLYREYDEAVGNQNFPSDKQRYACNTMNEQIVF